MWCYKRWGVQFNSELTFTKGFFYQQNRNELLWAWSPPKFKSYLQSPAHKAEPRPGHRHCGVTSEITTNIFAYEMVPLCFTLSKVKNIYKVHPGSTWLLEKLPAAERPHSPLLLIYFYRGVGWSYRYRSFPPSSWSDLVGGGLEDQAACGRCGRQVVPPALPSALVGIFGLRKSLY